MKTQEIRKLFLDFFFKFNHKIIKSSSLIPHNDKTLLFTNAGMVQFKDIFLGFEKVDFKKAVSSQKCVRAGGKHNDLENVGYTARHHTFFEMLGNFSFGDYFKKDACIFAWDFLTKVLKIDENKLWVTVFTEDEDAYNIWVNDIKVNKNRISKIGEKDNFWSMGATGPCGPCTEIFYDHGEHIEGSPPGTENEDGDRFVEIWNLVFMQYNKNINGEKTLLKNTCIDTGMGLERISAVMQNVNSNYEIDIFQSIMKFIAKTLNLDFTKYKNNPSLKVVADHIRSCSFLIADGVIPSNEGRGYVLRRIIRRASRHLHKLGAREVCFYKILDILILEMGDFYDELKVHKDKISTFLYEEEKQFLKTLSIGLKLFEENLNKVEKNIFCGEIAFKLYDTYGFPLDLTIDMAREKSLEVDTNKFNILMEEQKIRAKKSNTFGLNYDKKLKHNFVTEFIGYSNFTVKSKVLEIYDKNKNKVLNLQENEEGFIILDKTCFYAESGGQVGDSGVLENENFIFEVQDCQKEQKAFLHIGKVKKGIIKSGDILSSKILQSRRLKIAPNHTATHLLHKALKLVLGNEIEQRGSYVDSEKIRFDFNYNKSLSIEEIREVEKIINKIIRENIKVETIITDIENAKKIGAISLFGEKYENIVRVLNISNFSIEFCGGTHIKNTGEIGYFRIVNESSISSGIRRIEAITGLNAELFAYEKENLLREINSNFKANEHNILQKITKLLSQLKNQEQDILKLQKKLLKGNDSKKDIFIKNFDDIEIVFQKFDGLEAKILRETIDELKNIHKKAIICIASKDNEKIKIALGVTNNLTKIYKAGNLINIVAKEVGGKGGGRPDFAQAGGFDFSKIDNGINKLFSYLISSKK